MVLSILILVAACAAAAAETITQHRINELAAMCLEARMTLSGLKGMPKPGETPASYRGRVRGYVAALNQLGKDLAPIRRVPALKDGSAQNTQRWHKIVLGVSELSGDTEVVVKAWAAQSDPAARAQLGARLLHALETVQAILDGLRNARP